MSSSPTLWFELWRMVDNWRPKSNEEWRDLIDQYGRLRDLENPEFLRDAKRLIEDLKHDAALLHRWSAGSMPHVAALGIQAWELGAVKIRGRLTAKYDARLLRFVDRLLDRLKPEIMGAERDAARFQAWCLSVAAETMAIWTEVYARDREELRKHARGRSRSVGLDMLLALTIHCKPTEIADRLVAAKVLPERESDYDDPRAQWMQLLKRARSRYRRRQAPRSPR